MNRIIARHILFFLCAGFFSQSRLCAQSQYVPNVIPPSPNASSLIKFNDVPVSPYTGTADVAVPVYTIQGRGITVPISLNYHTGGVRIKEESGWVGLGWALSAGGTISRTIMDKDDFISGAYFNGAINVPQPLGDISATQNTGFINNIYTGNYFYDFFCNYLVSFTSGTADYYQILGTGPTPTQDLEPDIYNYSFAGHSGKFILTRDKKVLLQKQENIKIAFDAAGNWFIITDEQGNNYYFNDIEITESATGATSTIANSSWMLSKIVSAQQDTVKFNYYTDNTFTYTAPDYYDTYGAYCTETGFARSNSAGQLYLNKTLLSIDFSNGQVQFAFDSSRADIHAGKKLNSIKIYSKAGTVLKYIKEEDLYYSYFNSTASVNTYELKRLKLDSVKEVSGASKISPYVFTYEEGLYTSHPDYTAKHGYAVDHWGFYNGAGTNSTFIPNFNCIYDPPGVGVEPDYFSYAGANREANATLSQAFILKQVVYPTKGKTAFSYESNNYDWLKSNIGPNDFTQIVLSDSIGSVTKFTHGTTTGTWDLTHIYTTIGETNNATLTVTFLSTGSIATLKAALTFGKITFSFQGANFNIPLDVRGDNLTCGGPQCSITIPLSIAPAPSLIYTWTAYIDPSVDTTVYNETIAHLSWRQNNTVTAPTITGGGIRIKNITDYDLNNTIVKQRSYDYTYLEDRNQDGTPETYTYGKLMSFPSYARYSLERNAAGNPCTSLLLFGSSNTPLTSVSQGNAIGYDQVTERTVDPVTSIDIGKTVYTYFNSPDSTAFFNGLRMPGVLNMGNNLNGSMLSKSVYANVGGNYKAVSQSFYKYVTKNRIVLFSFKDQSTGRTAGGPSGICILDTGAHAEHVACFYPSIKSERVLLDSTTDIQYDQLTSAASIVVSKKNYYDNILHYQLTRSTTKDSKGNIITSLIKYPQDYIPGGFTVTGNTILDSLISKNMVAAAIEKRDSFYYSGSPTGYVKGAQLNLYKVLNAQCLALDKQYNLDLPSPVTDFQGFAISGNTITGMDTRYRQMVSFDSYNSVNNVQQYTPTDQLPVSFIWDYQQLYPIAQIKNAKASEVAYTSFEADGTGNWTIADTIRNRVNYMTGSQSFTLTGSNSISKSSLTSGRTYIVSYWLRNGTGTPSVNGITAVAGLVKNGWTYYQHALPNTTTTVTVTGTGNIDELRLYPGNAQMNTYTYTPLIGITSQCGANNIISYYEYDALGRLKLVRDIDHNVIKTIEYHYQNQIGKF